MSLAPENAKRLQAAPRRSPERRADAFYYIVYNGVLAILSPLVALYLTQRYVSGKSKPGWRQRWGRLPETLRGGANGKKRVWMHAVSAGEVVAAVPILRELRAQLPDQELLLSVLTPAGHEMALQQASRYVDGLFYFPFDLPWVARRVVQWVRPDIFVSLESELWPNVLHELKRTGASTVMVNGRISDKNFRRASRTGGLLFRWMLSNMDRLLVQSPADAERIRALAHIGAETARVEVVGNSKFDQEIARLTSDEVLALRRRLKLPDNAPIFVAGSTRSEEEETQVIAAYKSMLTSAADLCLVLAPRQIDRADEVAAAMRAAGLEPVRRTQIDVANAPVRHLILDTLGELANAYAVAVFAFVGNSFEPVNKGGGQNLLQPLAHGKAVLFGPRTATIRSEVALAVEAGVGFCVANGEALASQGALLLRDEKLRHEIRERAMTLIDQNRGVSTKYADAIAALTH